MFNFNSIWQTLLLLSFLVVVHEFGHFIVAKAFGVVAEEFSVGFGPLIGKFKYKGVQYSFRWFLLGGFVKIPGMDIALEGEAGKAVDREHSFVGLSLWKKIAVIAAGPLFNLILAMIMLFCMAAFVGLPSSLQNNAPIIEQAIPGTPAFDAGLRPGDKITAINNQPVNQWQDIPMLVKQSGGRTMSVRIERKGAVLTKQITPLYNPVDKRYIIGINPVPTYRRTSLQEAAKIAVTFPYDFTRQIFKSLGMIFKTATKGGLMGPIGMVSVIEQNASLPLYHNLFLAIQINLFLFIFNMLPLPLPLLDGGWIVILLLEKLFRREFTAEQKAAAQMVGMTAVLVLGVLVAYSDVLRLFRRFFGG